MITQVTRTRRVSLRVQVVDAVTGAPVAGAEVILAIGSDAAAEQAELLAQLAAADPARDLDACEVRATADALGRAVFWGLGAGRCSLAARAGQGGAGFGYAIGVATVSNASPVPWTTLALPSTLLTGTVTRPGASPGGGRPGASAPVPGAIVRLKGTGERAETDSKGRYAISGVGPGPRTLEVLDCAQPATTRAVTIAPAPAVTNFDISLG